jgi:hypothetical protein
MKSGIMSNTIFDFNLNAITLVNSYGWAWILPIHR